MTVGQPKVKEIFTGHWRYLVGIALLYLAVLVLGILVTAQLYTRHLTEVLLGYQLNAIANQALTSLKTDREIDFDHLQKLLQTLPPEGAGFSALQNDTGEEREAVLESLSLDPPNELADLESSLTRIRQILWNLRLSNPALEDLSVTLKQKDELVEISGADQPGFPDTSQSPILSSIGRSAKFMPTTDETNGWPELQENFRSGGKLQLPVRTENGVLGCVRVSLSKAEAELVAREQSQILAGVGLLSGSLLGIVVVILASLARRSSNRAIAAPLARLSQLLGDTDQNQDGQISLEELRLAAPHIEAFQNDLIAAREIHDITAATRRHLSLLQDTLEKNEELHSELRNALSRLEETSNILVHSSKGWMMAELGAEIADELNNKLQNASSISTLWLERDKPCPVRHLKVLHLSLEKALEQVEQFRLMSQPQDIKKVDSIPAQKLIEDLKRLVSQRIQQADVELHTEVERGLTYRNIAPGKLQDILMNLVFNACDAVAKRGDKDGRIHIRAQGTTLTVEDNGIRTPEPGEEGVRLRIVAGLATEFQGEVARQSKPGEGTTFTVTIDEKYVVL